MTLTRLALTDFRSYADATLSPGPGLVILTGENGAGKTNILEAISLLSPGRGLRGAALSDMARTGGSGGFAVAARSGDGDLGTGTRADAPERRLVRINGAQAPATALAEWLSTVWVTPAMDRLFAGTAGERRRFLDRLVLALDPAHAMHSTRYDAAMRQRNRLLAGDAGPDPAWLDALEAQMATHGAEIARARTGTVAAIGAVLSVQPQAPFARAEIALQGGDGGDLVALLRSGRTRDAAAGRTLDGPHRADVAVRHAAKAIAAAQCSTGEQKALLLGIVLAHAALVADRSGRPPLLLLDEVAAHLDPVRRTALFGRLAESGGQVWMTGTEAALFEAAGADATRYTVRDGAIA